MGNHIAPRSFCCRKQKQNVDYSDETWAAGKAEPISPRVAASQGEPMLRVT